MIGLVDELCKGPVIVIDDQVQREPYIKKIIREIEDANLPVLTYDSIEQAQNEYEDARILAMIVKQPAAAVGATTGKARLYGYDKDNSVRDDHAAELSESQKVELKRLAGLMLQDIVCRKRVESEVVESEVL